MTKDEFFESYIANAKTHNWMRSNGDDYYCKWTCSKCKISRLKHKGIITPPKYVYKTCGEILMRKALR